MPREEERLMPHGAHPAAAPAVAPAAAPKPAEEKPLDEAEQPGGKYIVNDVEVDAEGKPLADKGKEKKS